MKESGESVLHKTVIRGNLEMVLFLLNAGAKLGSRNEFGETADVLR